MTRSANTEIATTVGTLVAILIFAITYTIKLTGLKDKLEYRITNAEDKNTEQEKEICRLTEKVNAADVVFMEIKVRLANIEALLMEMKQWIKEK